MKRLNLALLVALVLALGTAVALDVGRRGGVEVIKGVTGAVERCVSCHPAGARPRKGKHPKIAGHADLTKHGCVVCHGGDGRRVDRGAHQPLPGQGHPPFYPRPFFTVPCVRCHVLGPGLSGAPRLARGQREYVNAGCLSCHLPGRRRQGLGFDLRFRPARTVEQIRAHLLSPYKATHKGKMMWSLTDATYRGRYTGSAEAERALQDLIAYLLALSESPELYKKAWARPKLRVDGKCVPCHRMGGKKPTGKSHRCPMLGPAHPELRCNSCHGTAQTLPSKTGKNADALRRCPQLRAAQPLCNTCHLRSTDGAMDLLQAK